MKLPSLILSGLFLMGAASLHAKQAPDFTLTDTNGTEHSLSGFAGKVVVLEWFNEGCPFVKKHYTKGNMQALQKAYTEKDVIWLRIISSAPGKQGHKTNEAHNATTEKWKVNSTALLVDADGKVGKEYGAKTTPHMFVISAAGEIAYQGAIDDKRSTNAAHIPDSKNYVKAALDSLLAGEKVEVSRTAPYGCSVKY